MKPETTMHDTEEDCQCEYCGACAFYLELLAALLNIVIDAGMKDQFNYLLANSYEMFMEAGDKLRSKLEDSKVLH